MYYQTEEENCQKEQKLEEAEADEQWEHPDIENLYIEETDDENDASKKVDLEIPVMEIMKALEEDESQEKELPTKELIGH